MKTKSKALLLTLCAVLLVAASVLGTMAYLTDKETVTNTFTVGKVSIKLDEAKVNLNGEPLNDKDEVVDLKGALRVTENSYKLMPGHTYTKDPTIHVDVDSEECYLFVKVENGIAAIEAEGNTKIASQMAAKGWKLVDNQTNVYVYIGTAEDASAPVAVKAGDDVTVFEKMVITDSVNGTGLAAYKDATIKVTAYAVQKDGFENKAASEIWTTAFTTTGA